MYWIYKHSFRTVHQFFHLLGSPLQPDPQTTQFAQITVSSRLFYTRKKPKKKRDGHLCLGI